MQLPPVFLKQGDRYVPTDCSNGPWSPDALHGGPAIGLLARAVEAAADDPELVPVRLTSDLFRVVPKAPLEVESTLLRDGRRIKVVQASLRASGVEVARATGVLLRTSEAPASPAWPHAVMPSGEGREVSSLMRGRPPSDRPRGFHSVVEVRWASEPGGPQAAWFRMPTELVEGETASAFVRFSALADFANAVASMSMRSGDRRGPTFINTDSTLYFSRRPQGEWLGMAADYGSQLDGIGLIEVSLHDERGRFGRSLNARLANR